MWRHVVIGPRCSWLHGDRRGFRSRGSRIESSGDYKAPPPDKEHEGLRKYHQRRSSDPIEFDADLRVIVCREFVCKARSIGIRIIAGSVGKKHLHALCEIDGAYGDIKRAIGQCKQKASHAIRAWLPGKVWCAGASFKRIRDVAL